MELSEDYTCVISRGANPKTTHIFDNCVVENYFGVSEDSGSAVPDNKNFLSICYTCKKSLEQKGDIFIYRFVVYFSVSLKSPITAFTNC
ncbi:unnamed protein product [Linum tenue]|uniref:FLZ-type domain-containing protein n=1 Tax=Linum tenue TaxID=586396 RepID=A0AAV0IVH7_9ROSI|nr:unnamed protein product [Linum tenue]